VAAGGVHGGEATPSPHVTTAAMARRAFELIDRDGGGTLSRAEVILAVRRDVAVRALLGLPATIRQEDGSRDNFERVFQAMDVDDSKQIDADEFERFVCGLPPSPRSGKSEGFLQGVYVNDQLK